MLVLTRKTGEQIIVGDNIKITVVSVGPGRVKIGIEAPDSVSVDRAEIHAKKQAEADAEPVGPPAAPAEAAEAPATLHNRIVDRFPRPTLAAVAARPRTPRKPR